MADYTQALERILAGIPLHLEIFRSFDGGNTQTFAASTVGCLRDNSYSAAALYLPTNDSTPDDQHIFHLDAWFGCQRMVITSRRIKDSTRRADARRPRRCIAIGQRPARA